MQDKKCKIEIRQRNGGRRQAEKSEHGKKIRLPKYCSGLQSPRDALSKLFTSEGGAGADGAILPYVGHLQLISTLKIGADCCQLCKYKLTKPNLT